MMVIKSSHLHTMTAVEIYLLVDMEFILQYLYIGKLISLS